jgi:hypothetical protein
MRGNDLVEAQAALLGLGGLLGREVLVGVYLIWERMLLDRARIARGLGRTLGVVFDGVFEIVRHDSCASNTGNAKALPENNLEPEWISADFTCPNRARNVHMNRTGPLS